MNGDASTPPQRILIIDDSPIALQMVGDALRGAGYDVTAILFPDPTLSSLTLAVAEIVPDLILADVEMPLMKGNEFVRIARASPALREMKFYFYSSLPESKLEELTRTAGADGFLRKSDDFSETVRRVQSILKRVPT